MRRSPGFCGDGALGPQALDGDSAALGQAELSDFDSNVFFPDAGSERTVVTSCS